MICARCQKPVPDGFVTCPACAREKSRAALWEYQMKPLCALVASRGCLNTRRAAGRTHVKMIGFDIAFCGESILNLRRADPLAVGATRPEICEACAEALARAITEATTFDAAVNQ